MKLSMWMLADRLKRFRPRLEISGGAATISGLRFITGELSQFLPEYVYIGRAADAFSDAHYSRSVMLVHGYDLMLLDNISLDDLFNEILLAFDFYNSWETKLLEASYAAEPVQEMVTASEAVFDSPVIILNQEGAVTAYSKRYGPGAFNDFWRELVDTGVSPTGRFGVGIKTPDGRVLPEWLKKPQVYVGDGRHPDYIAANLELDGEFVGAFLLLGFEGPFEPRHCQLAQRLCAAITQAAAGSGGNFELPSGALVLRQLLEGGEPSPGQVEQLSRERGAPWVLAAVKSIRGESTRLRKNTNLSKIRKTAARPAALLRGDEILALVDAAGLGGFLEELGRILPSDYFAVGISLPFSTWTDLPERRSQALFALENNPGQSGVFYCKDYAFEHMLTAYRSLNKGRLMLHPAPETLRQYDKIHKTELYKTLEVYLARDRNVVGASSALHVHRNTLLYRIKRILEIIDTPLEDPDERLYIRLSYKISESEL